MFSQSVKSLFLFISLVSSFPAMAEIPKGLEFTPENPLTPFALKKNGNVRKKFKIPYSVLVDYYKFAGMSTIDENKSYFPLYDIDMEELTKVDKDDVNFYIDTKRRRAYPTTLINPHSVSLLFVANPHAYIKEAEAPDFLSAKRKIYENKEFHRKSLRYLNDFIHLEDWRSLNHPPIHNLGDDLTLWDKDYTLIDYTKKESPFYRESFQKKIDEISGTELSFGNKINLLTNGGSYRKKIEEIAKAKKSVLMAVMSFYCDDTSRELEELLIKKVSEGVDVKLMVEKVWAKLATKKCMRRMAKGGVDIVYANDFLKKGEESALFHNKFVVIDNTKVVIGGSNIIESDNISTGYNHLNRDNDVYVEGPIATDAILSFVPLWKKYMNKKNELNKDRRPSVKDISYYEELALKQKAQEKSDKKRGAEMYSTILNDPSARNKGVCRMVAQSPDTDKYNLTRIFMEFFNTAEERMNLTTSVIQFDLPEHDEKERRRDTYNKKLFRSIFAATKRGVKLDFIGNGIDGGHGEISNTFNRLKLRNRFKFKPIHKQIYSMMTRYLDSAAAKKNQPYLEYIQNLPNARAWANFQYMHSKLIQIDRVVNIVSSYNLEEWSGDKSHEAGIICFDENLSREMDESFLRDFANSVPGAKTK